MKSSRLSLAADSTHKRLQEESSPSHANFLLNGNNLSQFSEQSTLHSVSSNNYNKLKFKNWFTYILHNTFGCKSCRHRQKYSSSKRSQNIKPFTTDSSYTFQRSPPTSQQLEQQENNEARPDLLIGEDRNFTTKSFISNDRSPTRHEIVDFSLNSNTSPQHSSSLANRFTEFEKMQRSVENKVVSI